MCLPGLWQWRKWLSGDAEAASGGCAILASKLLQRPSSGMLRCQEYGGVPYPHSVRPT